MRHGFRRVVVAAAALCGAMIPARAELFAIDRFVLYGDARLRAEIDWNSQDPNGVQRDDRSRLRARVRAGFRFEPNEHWEFGARLRTGQDDSQQSPHITLVDFNGNDTGDADFNFDRWYLRGRAGAFEATAGREELPFWKQDPMFFDDDVTMVGVSAKWTHDAGPGPLALAGGVFSRNEGRRRDRRDGTGRLAAGAWARALDLRRGHLRLRRQRR